MGSVSEKPEESVGRAGIVSMRSFDLLRKGTGAWRLDVAGLWSYPAIIPATTGDDLWVMLIAGTVVMPEKKRTAVFRPKTAIVTKACLPYIVRLESFRDGHDPFPSVAWDTPVAMFPHKSVGQLTPPAFQQKEAELLAMYPAASRELNESDTLPKQFREQYLSLIHPMFLPYLRHLTPRFFDALAVGK
jgi:hypothetical protein